LGLAYGFRYSVHYCRGGRIAASRQAWCRWSCEFNIFIWRLLVEYWLPGSQEEGLKAHPYSDTPTSTGPHLLIVPLPRPSIYKPSHLPKLVLNFATLLLHPVPSGRLQACTSRPITRHANKLYFRANMMRSILMESKCWLPVNIFFQ